MPDSSDELLTRDELLQETIALRQQVTELKTQRRDLELLQEVTTEHSDDVLADLHRKNQLIRRIFGRYLTDEVVSTLLEEPKALQLGGKRQMVSVLVADLRGFTALSENLSAEDVIKVLNRFLGQMTDIITQYEGTINDFTGDGIMVLFGAPTVRPNDAQRAVTCAVAMQLGMAQVNQQVTAWNLPELQMGIGVNTGEAVVGNIGSEKHTKYSAIGKQVNLAYRIESYTVGGQILISEQTLKNVQTTSPSALLVTQKKQVQAKGLSEPINVFEVEGIKRDNSQNKSLLLPHLQDVFYPLPEALSVKYSVLEGKRISQTTFSAHLVTLSARDAELRLASSQPSNITIEAKKSDVFFDPSALLMRDLRLNIWRSDRAPIHSDNENANESDDDSINHYGADIYAKVLSQNDEKGTVFIRFTSLPPDEAAYLTQLYQTMQTTLSIDLP
ncbi:MAG: adenylate/guanylate cyclase domain-containing protein [Cyanobacteria bacterium P01_F01_bin.150]